MTDWRTDWPLTNGIINWLTLDRLNLLWLALDWLTDLSLTDQLTDFSLAHTWLTDRLQTEWHLMNWQFTDCPLKQLTVPLNNWLTDWLLTQLTTRLTDSSMTDKWHLMNWHWFIDRHLIDRMTLYGLTDWHNSQDQLTECDFTSWLTNVWLTYSSVADLLFIDWLMTDWHLTR